MLEGVALWNCGWFCCGGRNVGLGHEGFLDLGWMHGVAVGADVMLRPPQLLVSALSDFPGRAEHWGVQPGCGRAALDLLEDGMQGGDRPGRGSPGPVAHQRGALLEDGRLGDRAVQGALHEIEVEAAARASTSASAAATVCTARSRFAMYLIPRASAELPGVDPGAGHGVQDRGDPVHAGPVAGRERGGAARRDHPGAAADRAVQQVAAAGPDRVAQPRRVTLIVLISMWMVPGRSGVVSVPAGPPMISSTAAASGTMDMSTSAAERTSAVTPATVPPAAASSGVTWLRR